MRLDDFKMDGGGWEWGVEVVALNLAATQIFKKPLLWITSPLQLLSALPVHSHVRTSAL